MYSIYGVVENEIIIYVGRTINFNNRQLEHKRAYGQHVYLKLLDTAELNHAVETETKWIKKLKPRDNIRIGGCGPKPGTKHTEERKAKIAAAHQARKELTSLNSKKMWENRSEELRTKLSTASKKRTKDWWDSLTPEQLEEQKYKISNRTRKAMQSKSVKDKLQAHHAKDTL